MTDGWALEAGPGAEPWLQGGSWTTTAPQRLAASQVTQHNDSLGKGNPLGQPDPKQEAGLSEPSCSLFKSGKLSEQTQRPEKTRVTQEASHWQ